MHTPRHLPAIFFVLSLFCLLILTWPTAGPLPTATLWAQNRPTHIPIYQIQGPELISPYYQKWVDTYGLVTGVLQDGFYLQDPLGDGDPATSDGIFVYTYKAPTVRLGQCVELTRAYVDEFYEKTELSRLKSVRPVNLCATTTVTPVAIPLARLGKTPATSFEQVEGMVVEVADLSGTVQGATKHFATGEVELALIPSGLHQYIPGKRVFQAHVAAMDALMYLTNALGATLPEAAWGTTIHVGVPRLIQNPDGIIETLQAKAIIDYNFGKYQLHLFPDTPVISMPNTLLPEKGGTANADDFTLCNFNVYGLGRGSAQFPDAALYDQQLGKRTRTIAETLQGCTVIGLQETGTPEDAKNLADLLRDAYNLDYAATAIAGPGTQNNEFPLTNSLLTRRARVQVLTSAIPQGCSRQNYEVPIVPGDCPPGEYALFDRPPLMVDLLITGTWGVPMPLTVIVNHWKSKAGDEAINAVRRTDQARYVATLVQQKIESDPQANVIVFGDLNDYYESTPIETLRTGVTPPLLHLYSYLPPLDRYTYVFNGGSQVLDHILITPNLIPMIATVDAIHSNADFAAADQKDLRQLQRSSDHDPVQVRLRPDGAAILGGSLRYPHIHVQLLNETSNVVGTTTTDEDGDFRLWNLHPGVYAVAFTPPPWVTITTQPIRVDLSAGYQTLPDIIVTHRMVKFGIALALTAAELTDAK